MTRQEHVDAGGVSRPLPISALVCAIEAALPFYEACDDPEANCCARMLRHALDQAAKAGARGARNGPH